MALTADPTPAIPAFKVRYVNQREAIAMLLALTDDYPELLRSKCLRQVHGSGAYLGQDADGSFYIGVAL